MVVNAGGIVGKLVLVATVVLWRQWDKNFWVGGLLNDRNIDQLLH